MICASDEGREERNRASAQHKRDAMALRSRQQTAAVSDIGELPEVEDPARRESCRLDLLRFLQTYFPLSTGLKPFGADQERMIGRMQRSILEGGRFVNVFPRGFAKTTISENTALWAVLYGHRRMVPVFGAGKREADTNIDSLKMELAENNWLYNDFPEVCFPIRALENKAQRCRSQTYRGVLTHIEWCADTVVLPTIPGSVASGAILSAHGLTAASRGMKYKRADGTQQRPDLIILDDPQTDESAASPLQIQKRLNVIKKSILKTGSHAKGLAVIVNGTIIAPGDLMTILLDPKRSPSWQGERIKMVGKWSDAHEGLWLKEYAGLRNGFVRTDLADQQRAHREATAFYSDRREKMDRGMEVSWQWCFDPETELSAVQHAYNLYIDDGPEVFASECQNEPIIPADVASPYATAEQIVAKLNRIPRGTVPAECTRLTAMVDVHKEVLYWLVAGWAPGSSGAVVDYGTWPKQQASYFGLADVKDNISARLPASSIEGGIYAALDALTDEILAREWPRDGGGVQRVEKCLVDANWGQMTGIVYQFCRQSRHAAVLLPSHGKFFGASSIPLHRHKRQPGETHGMESEWLITRGEGKHAVHHVVYDSNFWKTWALTRLSAAMGDSGSVSLFGERAEAHRLLADHLTAEYPVVTTARRDDHPGGRTVEEWKLRLGRDNHWLDCFVGCCTAASILGVRLGGALATDPGRQRRKVSLAKMMGG